MMQKCPKSPDAWKFLLEQVFGHFKVAKWNFYQEYFIDRGIFEENLRYFFMEEDQPIFRSRIGQFPKEW